VPHQYIIDKQPPLPGQGGLNSGRLAGATSNMAIVGTQQVCRNKLVYRNAANAATKHMTENANLKTVTMTGSGKNKKQHAVGCEYINTVVKGGQSTM
jgi:hypothetical protein